MAELLSVALDRVARAVPGRPQTGEDPCPARFLEPEYSEVGWSRSAREIHDQVRAFRFFGSREAPVARLDDRRIRLVRTSLEPAAGIRAECGDGPIWIVGSAPLP